MTVPATAVKLTVMPQPADTIAIAFAQLTESTLAAKTLVAAVIPSVKLS